MTFEETLSNMNEAFFFREFTFSNPTTKKETEIELADNLVWLNENLIIYQLKEREIKKNINIEEEIKWFENKVLNKSKKQIKNTLKNLESCRNIKLKNHRGHIFDFYFEKIKKIHKLILFKPNESLDKNLFNQKYYNSQDFSIIHLISSSDYVKIIKILITPSEIMDYLDYRENLALNWDSLLNDLTEEAIIGHYLYGKINVKPCEGFILYLKKNQNKIDDWNISYLIYNFKDKITSQNTSNDYYLIILALSSLKRNELKEFKYRFLLAKDKARSNLVTMPFRIAFPRLSLGFIFIPLTLDFVQYRTKILLEHTDLHKYEQKLDKCIGISIATDGPVHYTIEWCLENSAWHEDFEKEAFLKNNAILRDVKEVDSKLYY